MNATLNPYINYAGSARQAMEFYQSIFGGELTMSTFGEAGVPNAPADGIMHAQLSVDGATMLMSSDGLGDDGKKGFSLSLNGNDAAELRGYWTKLSEGGEITKPLEKESWGDEFGMLVDKFGVTWMVNIDAQQAAPAE